MSERKFGFAAMDPEKRAEIAKRGGQRAHELGRAHRFTTDEARAAGQKSKRGPSRRPAPPVEPVANDMSA